MFVVGRKKGTKKNIELQGDLGVVFLGSQKQLELLEKSCLGDFEELTEVPEGPRTGWAEKLKGKKLMIKQPSLIEGSELRVGHLLEEMFGVVEDLVVLYSGEDREALQDLIGRDGIVGILSGIQKPVLVSLVANEIMLKKDLVDYADNLKKCKASGQTYVKVKRTTYEKEELLDIYLNKE